MDPRQINGMERAPMQPMSTALLNCCPAAKQAAVLTCGINGHCVDAAAAPDGLKRRVLPRRRRRKRHAAQAAGRRVPLQQLEWIDSAWHWQRRCMWGNEMDRRADEQQPCSIRPATTRLHATPPSRRSAAQTQPQRPGVQLTCSSLLHLVPTSSRVSSCHATANAWQGDGGRAAGWGWQA